MEYGHGIAVDAGQVYLTGEFQGTASFDGDDPLAVTSGGGLDAFLAVLDADTLAPS
ncbi:MAG: hypothetical protein HQ581_24095 [Planctomycetes bacterium]|nr:hypothetical protein [Planctomycetota bacterium]